MEIVAEDAVADLVDRILGAKQADVEPSALLPGVLHA